MPQGQGYALASSSVGAKTDAALAKCVNLYLQNFSDGVAC